MDWIKMLPDDVKVFITEFKRVALVICGEALKESLDVSLTQKNTPKNNYCFLECGSHHSKTSISQ